MKVMRRKYLRQAPRENKVQAKKKYVSIIMFLMSLLVIITFSFAMEYSMHCGGFALIVGPIRNSKITNPY